MATMKTMEQTPQQLSPKKGMKIEQTKAIEKEITDYEQECKNYINELITFAKSNESEESKDFGKFEGSLFKKLLKAGNMLSHLYFEKKTEISAKK